MTVALPLASTVCVISVVTGAICSIARSKLRAIASRRIACCSMVACSAVRGGSLAVGTLRFRGGAGPRGCAVRSGLEATGGVGVATSPCAPAGSLCGTMVVAPSAGCVRTAACCRRGDCGAGVVRGSASAAGRGGEGPASAGATGGSIRTCNRLGGEIGRLTLSPSPINGSNPNRSA